MSKIKPWEELTLSDNFIFQKVMLNKELCKKVLSEILGVEVVEIKYPENEKNISIRRDSKGIRLDVYVRDMENTVYNIEMQQSSEKDLPKRTRYYQGMIDMDLLEKGAFYDELNRSFVIFICDFDYYGLGQYKYTFSNKCEEIEGLELGDETTKIFLNSKGTKGVVSEDLKIFLQCINGEYNSSEFSGKIKEEVYKVKRSEKWRTEYMIQYLHEQELEREAKKEGMRKGIEEGRKEGRKEGMREGMREGRKEGFHLSVEIIKAYKSGMSVEEISKELNASIEDVEFIVQQLG